MCLLPGTQDAPDGDFRDLKKSGQMARKGNVWATMKAGMLNYRTWVLMLTYGYCFGVELTVDNIIVSSKAMVETLLACLQACHSLAGGLPADLLIPTIRATLLLVLSGPDMR